MSDLTFGIIDESPTTFSAGDPPIGPRFSARSLISREQFSEALFTAAASRPLAFREQVRLWRAKRNPRVLDRLYDRVVEQIPEEIYGGEWGFDFQSLLDWLVENLPAILEILAKLLPLLAFI